MNDLDCINDGDLDCINDKFEMVPIIVGALGYVPKELKTKLEKLNFNENEVKSITRKLQTISASATVKIMKTFMGFKM